MLTPEEVQVVKDTAQNIRFKIDGYWEVPVGYQGRL